MADAAAAGPAPDLHSARVRRTHAAIVQACRRLMLGGDFRPIVGTIATAADVAPRTVFQHFGSIEALYHQALDEPTRDAIAALIVPLPALIQSPLVRENMAYAAVFSRSLPVNTE